MKSSKMSCLVSTILSQFLDENCSVTNLMNIAEIYLRDKEMKIRKVASYFGLSCSCILKKICDLAITTANLLFGIITLLHIWKLFKCKKPKTKCRKSNDYIFFTLVYQTQKLRAYDGGLNQRRCLFSS